MIQQMLAIWSLVVLNPAWTSESSWFMYRCSLAWRILSTGEFWAWVQLCGSLDIPWHYLSLGLEWKLIFSIPVATAEFSKFAGILSEALSQQHLLGFEIAQLEDTYSPWNSLDENTGVGSLSLLQGIFPTQGSNPGVPHYRWILYQLSHQGSPGILEWVAYPFSSGSSQPRNWTRVSCIACVFFTNWAMRETLTMCNKL